MVSFDLNLESFWQIPIGFVYIKALKYLSVK